MNFKIYFLYFFFLLKLSTSYSQSTPKEQYNTAFKLLTKDVHQAEIIGEKLLKSSIDSKKEMPIATSLSLMGMVYYYKANYYLSNKYYFRALNSAFSKKSKPFQESCYNNIAVNYEMLGQYGKSIKYYNKSLKITEQSKDSVSMAESWINLGLINHKVDNHKLATSQTKAALKYFIKSNDSLQMALCHHNLSLFYFKKNKYIDAENEALTALQLYEVLDHKLNEAKTLVILSDLYVKQQKIKESNKFLHQALDLECNNDLLIATIYTRLATNKIAREEYKDVEKYLQNAYLYFNKVNSTDNRLNDYYSVRSDFYAKTNNYDAFLKNKEEYEQYNTKIETSQAKDKYRELQAVYEYESQQGKIEAHKKELFIKKKELSISRYQIGLLIIILLTIFIIVGIIATNSRKRKKYIQLLFSSNVREIQVPKIDTSDSSDTKFLEIYNNLLHLMENEKLYTNPNLSVNEICKLLATNSKYLSLAINKYAKTNFNGFINSYRIADAKKLILFSDKSLKEISSEIGFNNHTTFYRQFKESIGMSPKQFQDLSILNKKESIQ
ncbi:helix-turn-helix domain-containing protein [Flavobacterium arcticum]|uniref:Helix-turn-helix domain-containing protein n=1 Tax=Flavobacterium arcticum TaxID=1784713 RepID=A0A345HB96_9FLAO|nr:tetratricopeptide repeat protein [Flavobacterium arcticum]AXG73856.1 helix-turn-helix domain-containing protein [Flavobacterium arcticum]KAF2511809.1 tetratricopeptide repeat protein [Flavobacterium arcticum]